ncbi:hypothetical protein HOD08_04940 [bacterium]|jgi:hypothetical protein|nr:hypothetical protein [bacterium]
MKKRQIFFAVAVVLFNVAQAGQGHSLLGKYPKYYRSESCPMAPAICVRNGIGQTLQICLEDEYKTFFDAIYLGTRDDATKNEKVYLKAAKKITKLWIHSLGIDTIPAVIGELTGLSELWLQPHTSRFSLPLEIKKLHKLRTLWVNCSLDLTSLPKEIFQLRELTELDLRGNNLTSLPPEIGLLTNLKSLNLSNNRLTSLPQEISNLTNLEELWLLNNLFTTIPPEIFALMNLKSLSTGFYGLLSIDGNCIDVVPSDILALTKLEKLYLSGNNFTSIPPAILELPRLELLGLARNKLETLPPGILQMTKLKNISLSGNPIWNNRAEVPEEIMEFLEGKIFN